MREDGAILVDGVQSGTTAHCPHCSGHFLIASNGTLTQGRSALGEMARPRVFCRKCGRLTCGRLCCDPAVFGCIPIEARLEHTEGTKTRYDDAIQDLRRRDLSVAHDNQRFGDHQSHARCARLSRFRNVQTFERWMVADVIRRVAVRHLPQDLTPVETDRREDSVRRFDDG
jgi:hypothetical protein